MRAHYSKSACPSRPLVAGCAAQGVINCRFLTILAGKKPLNYWCTERSPIALASPLSTGLPIHEERDFAGVGIRFVQVVITGSDFGRGREVSRAE